MPDDFIPTFDLDLEVYESTRGSSHHSSAFSGGSPRSSESSFNEKSALGLEIPSSESGNIGGFQLPGSGPGSAVRESHPFAALEDEDGFDPHVGFEFDEDGNMLDLEVPETGREIERRRDTRIGSDSALSDRVRLEHDQARLIAQQAVSISHSISFSRLT